MPLPSFTVKGTLFDLLGNVDGSEISPNPLGAGRRQKVTFTSNVPINQLVVFDGASYRVKPVEAEVLSDGSIKRNGEPVLLLANDEGLNVEGLQWRVDVAGMTVWFDAPEDGQSVDLKDIIDEATAARQATAQASLDAAVGAYVEANRSQFRTRAVPIIEGPDAGLYQWVDADDEPVGDPVELSEIVNVAWDGVTEKPENLTGLAAVEDGIPERSSGSWSTIAPGTAGRGVLTAETEAAARAAVGSAAGIAVSHFLADAQTVAGAIHAAIAAAAELSNAAVDFEGRDYAPESTIYIADPGITLCNGGITPAGQFPALQISTGANNVTVRNMRFSRSTSGGFSDSQAARSCVVIKAENAHFVDCDILASNMNGYYLDNGKADGTTIEGGSITIGGEVSPAGIRAASGEDGHRHIAIRNVRITDASMGIVLFDTSSSLVEGCRVSGIRRMQTVELTDWELVSGNIYRQRSASGEPGTTGVTTDREDGNTNVVRVDGVEIDVGSGTSPDANTASISGGYVYINLGGADPSTKTITSDTVSGYAYQIYTLLAECSRNKFVNNHAEDCDGFGIYFQLGDNVGGEGNVAIGNTLKDVALAGKQTRSLAFSGFGIFGGSDTTVDGCHIDGTGGEGSAAVPGIFISPTQNSFATSGKIVGTTVRNAAAEGFYINSSGFTLSHCEAHGNAAAGFSVSTASASQIVRSVLMGCTATTNSGGGIVVANSSVSGGGFVSGRIIGGAVFNNTGQRGILVGSASVSTHKVRDVLITGVDIRDNGSASIPQILVRNTSLRTVIVGNVIGAPASSGRTGIQVTADPVDTVIFGNTYNLLDGTPEDFSAPVAIGSTKVGVPDSNSATGSPGQWAADSDHLYVCIATDTWVRAALATWT